MNVGAIFDKDKVLRRVLIFTRKTDEPCSKCGKPIQPGQLYVPDPVRHFGCKP